MNYQTLKPGDVRQDGDERQETRTLNEPPFMWKAVERKWERHRILLGQTYVGGDFILHNFRRPLP